MSEHHPDPSDRLRRILERARQIAYTNALRVLKNTWEAEDIASWTLLRLYERWDTLQVPEAWPGWVQTTALNKAKDRWEQIKRQRHREQPLGDDETANPRGRSNLHIPSPNQTETFPARIEAEELWAVLPPYCREIMALLNVGFNQLEISERLGVAHGTVRNRTTRCRKIAKEWRRRLGYEEEDSSCPQDNDV